MFRTFSDSPEDYRGAKEPKQAARWEHSGWSLMGVTEFALQRKMEPFLYWLICVVIAGAILTFDLSQPRGVSGGVPYVLLVLMGLIANDVRATAILCITALTLNAVGYILSSHGASIEVVLINRGTAFLVITAVSVAVFLVVKQRNIIELTSQLDPLTNCYNRNYLVEMLDSEIANWKTFERPLSVIMIDIDHFKAVNDVHGHQAGDQVLRRVADACRANLRGADRICRYGGEEFAVVLPDAACKIAALVAERIRMAVSQIPLGRNTDSPITVSLGVAEMSADCESADALLHAADTALYLAKDQGRNQVKIGAPGKLIDFSLARGGQGRGRK